MRTQKLDIVTVAGFAQYLGANGPVRQPHSICGLCCGTEQTCGKLTSEHAPKHVEEIKADPNVKAAIQEMERKLGTRVHVIEGSRGKGKIEIHYYSAEDLDRIYDTIMGEP